MKVVGCFLTMGVLCIMRRWWLLVASSENCHAFGYKCRYMQAQPNKKNQGKKIKKDKTLLFVTIT